MGIGIGIVAHCVSCIFFRCFPDLLDLDLRFIHLCTSADEEVRYNIKVWTPARYPNKSFINKADLIVVGVVWCCCALSNYISRHSKNV